MTKPTRSLRCAVYTRKSTEHGLELEFNSLHAQREACEAYIKSQASQGWSLAPKHYDDPAYSGGSLERPALQELLADIEAGNINVVVVYKIDRLTRSLADFAKLVEMFDAKGISFVAVTQQFNTTSSMGRLTLNVLLSFAQFERELSSERVRDKIAASRRKGKWTGGPPPLGYRSENKKLVVDEEESAAVRMIFKRYIVLRSFQRLVAELDKRDVVSKRRQSIYPKTRGGIPFTYGPLAYLLKNRIYLGEIAHDKAWFKGEHEAILDKVTFDKVQAILAENRIQRSGRRMQRGSWLTGKIFDDAGNRMSPSWSSKGGVRYRFYISRALLSGRSGKQGSIGRVPAVELEAAVEAELRKHLKCSDKMVQADVFNRLGKLVVGRRTFQLHVTSETLETEGAMIDCAWKPKENNRGQPVDPTALVVPNQKLVQAVARAHTWLKQLADGSFARIDDLASHVHLHPKVVRQELRMAFLAPDITRAILEGAQPAALSLASIPKTLPLCWADQRRVLGFPRQVEL